MEKSDYMESFINKYFNPILKDKLEELNKYYIDNNESLKKEFLDLFYKVIQIYETENNNSKIIFYSMLRTSMFLDKKVEYLTRDYNVNISLKYDGSWAFKGFFEIEEELEKSRKLYVGNVSKIHVKELLYKSIHEFAEYIILVGRQVLSEIDISEIRYLRETEWIYIVMGDYMGLNNNIRNTEQICIFRKPKIDNNNILEWFEKNKGGVNSCWFQNLNISKCKLKNRDFTFTNFEKCNIENVDFTMSNFDGSKFISCELLNTNFFVGSIVGTDFSKSNLEGSNFDFTVGFDTYKSNLNRANFSNANLKDTLFRTADLRNAIFTGANFENTNFTGANLQSATFSKELKDSEMFTEEQRQNIIWV